MEWEDDYDIYSFEYEDWIFKLVIGLRIRSGLILKIAISECFKDALVRMKTMSVMMLLKDLTSEAAVMMRFGRRP